VDYGLLEETANGGCFPSCNTRAAAGGAGGRDCLFTAAMAFGAYVRVPLPWTPVPVTLQTFFVILAGAFLGASAGSITNCCTSPSVLPVCRCLPTGLPGRLPYRPHGRLPCRLYRRNAPGRWGVAAVPRLNVTHRRAFHLRRGSDPRLRRFVAGGGAAPFPGKGLPVGGGAVYPRRLHQGVRGNPGHRFPKTDAPRRIMDGVIKKLFLLVTLAACLGAVAHAAGMTSQQVLSISIFSASILGTLFFWDFRLSFAFIGTSVLLMTKTIDLEHVIEFASLEVILFSSG